MPLHGRVRAVRILVRVNLVRSLYDRWQSLLHEVTAFGVIGGVNFVLDLLLFNLFREVFGNPFRPVTFSPEWRTDTAVSLAQQMYESRDFGAMPILADALQDAGCTSDDVLNHCHGAGPHVRGCWVVDLVLGKQ